MDEQQVGEQTEVQKLWARVVALEQQVATALKPAEQQAVQAVAPVVESAASATIEEIIAQLEKHGIRVTDDTKAEVAAAKIDAQGSGSERWGGSDWTAVGRTADGFPVPKGTAEDVS